MRANQRIHQSLPYELMAINALFRDRVRRRESLPGGSFTRSRIIQLNNRAIKRFCHLISAYMGQNCRIGPAFDDFVCTKSGKRRFRTLDSAFADPDNSGLPDLEVAARSCRASCSVPEKSPAVAP